MDSQQTQRLQTPILKMEVSPADSLMSVPSSVEYPSLFSPGSVDTPASVGTPEDSSSPVGKPADMFASETAAILDPAPKSEADLIASFSIPLVTPPAPPTPPAEKKPTKKRKSWGQALPEPKTSLPPRKRAKTEDEKEQRRVERVLRNRRAAQSSRERKRLETEKLEQKTRELELHVARLQRANYFLLDTVKMLRSGGQVTNSPALESLLNNPTLGSSLFPSSQSTQTSSILDLPASSVEGLSATVDPARLSPPVTSIPEEGEMPAPKLSATPEPSTPAETPIDLAQHPAAVLCDLQCQSMEQLRQVLMESRHQQRALAWMIFLTSAVSAALSIFQSTTL